MRSVLSEDEGYSRRPEQLNKVLDSMRALSLEMNPLVLPFGQYNGELVTEVFGKDPKYLRFIRTLDWVEEKYVDLFNLITLLLQ